MEACILETSKLHMYQFWYDHLKEKYNNKIQLIYTDSFVIEINTDDIYKNMFENKDLCNFSEYPTEHPNYNVVNKKVLGKFKDELNSKLITEFCALKPKMYSYNYIDNYKDMLKNCKSDECKLIKSKMNSNEYIDNYTILNENKHKGIKTVVDLKHKEYKRSLYKEELIYQNFYNLQLSKQKIYFDKINKIALNPFDSKRHWLNNIESVLYGYKI